MASTPANFPISLRSWPQDDASETSLATLIGRINTERGNFREISEESLLEEARNAANTRPSDDADEQSDTEDEPDRMKALMKARGDILGQIEQAHQASMVALDFLSLLLSKDMPVQAGLSISPVLKEAAGMGTIGVDLTQSTRLTEAQRATNKKTVKGWKIQSLTQTVDSILASATRLEKGIEAETKYWEQVLAVVGKGWDMARLPQERHTLGVRIGFAECAPAFKHRSLAALRSNADGSIVLDQGLVDSRPKRVRVRVKTDGKFTGTMRISKAVSEDAPLEDLILEARNTVFNEELWQEMNREARYLLNQGVSAANGEITCELTTSKALVFDLVSLDVVGPNGNATQMDDYFAEGISLALQLLLVWAHRQNYRRRTQPPAPLTSQKRTSFPYSLLRAIVTKLHYEELILSFHALLIPLCETMRCAGFTESSYKVMPRVGVESMKSLSSIMPDTSATESVMENVIQQLETDVELRLTDSHTFNIKFRTSMHPFTWTHFKVIPSGILVSEEWQPPPRMSSFDEVRDYILYAIPCSIAAGVVPLPTPPQDTQSHSSSTENEDDAELDAPISASGSSGWLRTTQGNVLRKSFAGKELRRVLTLSMDEPSLLQAECFAVNGEGREVNHKRWLWNSNGTSPTENGKSLTLSDMVEIVGKWQAEADTAMTDAT